MTGYEIKKVFSKASGKIALALIGAVVVVVSLLAVSGVWYVNEEGEYEYGYSGVQKLKEEKEQWKGYVTPELLARAIERNAEINGEEGSYGEDGEETNKAYSKKQGFSDLRNLISFGFSDFSEYDYFRIDKVSPKETGHFYENRVGGLKKWLEEAGDAFSDREKEYLISEYEKLESPMYYESCMVWERLETYLPTVIGLVSLILGFLSAGIFAGEFRHNAESVFFSACYGRDKAVKSKVKAGLLIVTGLYWASVMALSLFFFIWFGVSGAGCPIQACGGWKSFYNITCIQEYLLMIFQGYIGSLFICLAAMLVSVKTKSIPVSVTVPFILSASSTMVRLIPGTEKLAALLPEELFINGTRTFELYQIGQEIIPRLPLMFLVYIPLTLILIPVLYLTYRKTEIK